MKDEKVYIGDFDLLFMAYIALEKANRRRHKVYDTPQEYWADIFQVAEEILTFSEHKGDRKKENTLKFHKNRILEIPEKIMKKNLVSL